ncbi:MAG: hypothetical protein AB7Q97_23655 [Gammaproteobacteria bacterium]
MNQALRSLTALLTLACIAMSMQAVAQRKATRVDSPTRTLQKIPTLELELLGGEFASWGRDLVILQPRPVRFRWGDPIKAGQFRWELFKGTVSAGNLQGSGTLNATPHETRLQDFRLDLNGRIPAEPPPQETLYLVRVVPLGENLAASNTVTIRYRRDTSQTRFSFTQLYPEFTRPMRVKVDLNQFEIIKADEESDEEPYIIPIVAYLDGTTINVVNLPGSTVRVDTSARHNAHGNISTQDNLGSGMTVTIPDETGYFERTILPINIDLDGFPIPNCTLPEKDCRIGYRDLTRATTVFILVLAFEEDAIDDSVINAARDTVLADMRAQFNLCISSMTVGDIQNFVTHGLDAQDVLTTEEPGVNFCRLTSGPDRSILRQLRERFTDLAKETAIDEIIFDPINLFHGGAINALDDLLDRDDYIGFDWHAVTYDELMQANGHLPFQLNFHKRDNSGLEEAAIHPVTYRIRGTVARCEHIDGQGPCVTRTRPLLPKFP